MEMDRSITSGMEIKYVRGIWIPNKKGDIENIGDIIIFKRKGNQ